MAKINVEFKKGILFVRIEGALIKSNIKESRGELLPIVLKEKFKYIVLNFDKVNYIDASGVEMLIDLNEMVSSWEGKTSICNITNNLVRIMINNSELSDLYFQTNNELTAIGVFNI